MLKNAAVSSMKMSYDLIDWFGEDVYLRQLESIEIDARVTASSGLRFWTLRYGNLLRGCLSL